jgi:hypothetical protein
MRMYHVVAINEKTGRRELCTSYPATHSEACTMVSKFTAHKNVRIQLQEIVVDDRGQIDHCATYGHEYIGGEHCTRQWCCICHEYEARKEK